ncbi:MAG TPA: ATP-binding protein [Bacillota bacterium]|jgi:lon-related putative ATP-dependent protease|nr:ATP-binding protein [Bacillota bacterium]HOP68423.1 ATP-binding protein [Bacillota bacterium]HPT33529.1 ATP-binding protein [Bacillota bacterium]
MPWEELTPEELKYKLDPQQLPFETTAEVPPLEGMIGQERAERAMEFGLRIKRPGYNIFMTGLTGTGKTSYAQTIVKKISAEEPVPDDWFYVYNFENPGEPMALRLPAGMGSVFCREMEELLEDIKQTIPKAFDGEDYERQKAFYVKQFQETRAGLLEELNQVAREQGFTLKRTSSGFITVPLVNGEPISEENYAQLEQSVKEELEQKSSELQLKAMEIMRRIQKAEKQLKEKFKNLQQEIGLMAIGHLFNDLMEKYDQFEPVKNYLKAVQEDILSNLSEFMVDEEEAQNPFFWLRRQNVEQAEIRYKVNLVVDNRETCGSPVIYETNPSYYNLIGRVEYENRLGMIVTDLTMIKGGAIHRANCGYLILQARDVLSSPQSWEALKRVLKTREIRIENIGEQYGLMAMSTLRPQPIPANLKVIMIGSPLIYQLLYHYDEDFRKLFKVKADFDSEMDRNQDNIYRMAGFISTHCQQENLRHFHREAVARVVEFSARLAERQDKMSTRFNEVVELLYEADAWAERDGSDIVKAEHVDKALEEKIYRCKKYEQKISEAVERGLILLDVEGEKIGQINGLSVIDLGDYQFGRVSRITANTFLGRRGIINIERESQLSGKIHDKGVLILSGYLGMRYGQQVPINLSASLCFEQSYQGVEGDSASAAELFCLLSSLAGVPLKQSLAVTGSVNQKGEIQPVGGVNQKIEGFYNACKVKGLTGDQGVIIPAQNRKDLMLSEEIVTAVREKRFHIYAISTVEEGLALLTGMEIGELREDGTYPPDSFNGRVISALKRFNELLKGEEGEEGEGEEGGPAPKEDHDCC